MFESIRKLFRTVKCPHCGKTLTELRVRLKPGEAESGPYYRCDSCGHRYLTESGALVQAGPSPKPGEPFEFDVAAKPPKRS